MNIEQLIEQLQQIKNNYGDLPVLTDADNIYTPIYDIYVNNSHIVLSTTPINNIDDISKEDLEIDSIIEKALLGD